MVVMEPVQQQIIMAPVHQEVSSRIVTTAPVQQPQVLLQPQQVHAYAGQMSQQSSVELVQITLPRLLDGEKLGLVLFEGTHGNVFVQGLQESGGTRGFKVGDQITELNACPVTGQSMMLEAIASMQKLQQPLIFQVVRTSALGTAPNMVGNTANFIGTWVYADSADEDTDTYQYEVLENEGDPGLFFKQTLPSQEVVSGVLQAAGGNEYQGRLVTQTAGKSPGKPFGDLQLRFDASRNKMVSKLRAAGEPAWGQEVDAYKQ